MVAVRWNPIPAPNRSSGNALIIEGSRNINPFNDFAKILNNRQDRLQDEATSAVNLAVSQASTPEEVAAAISAGTQGKQAHQVDFNDIARIGNARSQQLLNNQLTGLEIQDKTHKVNVRNPFDIEEARYKLGQDDKRIANSTNLTNSQVGLNNIRTTALKDTVNLSRKETEDRNKVLELIMADIKSSGNTLPSNTNVLESAARLGIRPGIANTTLANYNDGHYSGTFQTQKALDDYTAMRKRLDSGINFDDAISSEKASLTERLEEWFSHNKFDEARKKVAFANIESAAISAVNQPGLKHNHKQVTWMLYALARQNPELSENPTELLAALNRHLAVTPIIGAN